MEAPKVEHDESKSKEKLEHKNKTRRKGIDLYGNSNVEVLIRKKVTLEEPILYVEKSWLWNNICTSIGHANDQFLW